MMISDLQMEGAGRCIISNRKSQPGMITVRGCTYAGSKGVVFGSIKGMVHISHGPIGRGQYSRAGQRNYYIGINDVDGFGALSFTSDFQERDIVFGGDKKLTRLIEEMEQLFPLTRGITIQSEYPVSLIGDSINAVISASSKALDEPMISVRCEDFRGVSQSLNHHIANDVVHDRVLSNHEGQPFASTPYDVAIIGDYNVSGDAWTSRILLEEMGLRLVAQWSGDGTLMEVESTPFVELNLVHCYRSMDYITCHMEGKHQIPWMEYNFFGPTKIAGSLRRVADQFGDTIRINAEVMIAKYEEQMAVTTARYRPRLERRKVLLYIGGLRPRRVIGAHEDLGMEIVAAGYESAHNDDYDRALPDLKEGALLFGDASSYELEAFVKALKPDLIDSGIKEEYIFQEMGVPFRQMHSWDYSGPYHNYDGFAIFTRNMNTTLNNPAWNELAAPWLKSA